MVPRVVRFGAPVQAVLFLISIFLFSLGVGVADAGTPSFFTGFNQPIGVAASHNRLFITAYCGDPRYVYSIDAAGNKQVFARLPNRGGGCYEDYLAISPGMGGFPANYIYVMQGPNVIQVDTTGTSVSVFATIPGLPSTHNGITFDQVGTFGHDMIVTGSNGTVWRVSSGGALTLVANIGRMLEGPVVAPMTFAPYGGMVIAASEGYSAVYAIAPGGASYYVAYWPSAESIHVIPDRTCNFGTSGGAFFSAIYPTHIEKFPPSDFTGLGGRLLVTSEGGGTGLMTSTGGGVATSVFETPGGQHEGSAFVDCAVPPPNCTINPSVGWDAPLSATTPYPLHNGATLPIRFYYGTCAQFMHDESVVIVVREAANQDHVVTAWVYGSDIAIDDAGHEYAQDFHSGQYQLANGAQLMVDVYIGDMPVGQAPVNIIP